MDKNLPPNFESPESKKIEVLSQKGIIFRQEDRKFLDIPNGLVRSLIAGRKIGRDAINVLHAEVFDGSYVFWGEPGPSFYTIELARQATQDQIQNLIDKIEGASDNKN